MRPSRSRGAIRVIAMLLAAVPCARAALDENGGGGPRKLPDARELLAAVLDSLPGEPVAISAQLQSRNAAGGVEQTLRADMTLNWGGRPPSARYTVYDAFGASLEGLHVAWQPDGGRSFAYFTGDPLIGAPVPDLFAPIRDTDLSWSDLSLSYLWWPGGRTVGEERIKGRSCFIVDLPAPPGEAGRCAGVRLWLDPQIRILLQAAAYDAQGRMDRLLEVRSFKKVRGVWVIQDVDVRSFPSRHKTSLRVRETQAAEK